MRSLATAGVVLALWICTNRNAAAQSPIPNLIRSLESDKKPVRLQAARGLGNCGKGAQAAVPALRSLLEREQDGPVYLQAMKALTQIGAHAELQMLLQHPNPVVRQQAAWGLGVIGPDAKKAVPELIKLLKDQDPMTRGLAAQSLGEIGLQSQEEARALLNLLADPKPEVRLHAQGALMSAGSLSIPALESMLNDKEPTWVRSAILQILACQGPEAKQALPALTRLLKDADAKIRAQAIGTIAALGSAAKDALPDLFESLHDRDMNVQVAAFSATMSIGMEDRRSLAEGLRRANARGRWAIAPTDSVPALTKKLKDTDPNVRQTAALALGQLGKDAEPAAPAMIELLKDENPHVRYAAQQALAQLDQKNRAEYLRRCQLEQAQMLREAQQLKAKLHADQVKIARATNIELARLQSRQVALIQQARLLTLKTSGEWAKFNAENDRIMLFFQKARNDPFNVVTQDQAQQAYIQKLVQMHINLSIKADNPAALDWVAEQVLAFGTEAVPALAQGYKQAVDRRLGFV